METGKARQPTRHAAAQAQAQAQLQEQWVL
jgi:hypothetical protein